MSSRNCPRLIGLACAALLIAALGAACTGAPGTAGGTAPPGSAPEAGTGEPVNRGEAVQRVGSVAREGEALLNEAPRFEGDVATLGEDPASARLDELAPAGAQESTGLRIDADDRAAVIRAYRDVYLGTASPSADWDGATATCAAGTISARYRDAILARINYFRAMTGQVGRVKFDPILSYKAQQAALMMDAAKALDHTPDASWPCYTPGGAEAAGRSNLFGGRAGPDAITGYIEDPGAGNSPVGHRRWVLYPPTTDMGVGDTGWANALWVIGGFGERPSQPAWVAWPPPGYVPYRLAFDRWSFSFPDADFSQASVTMRRGGRTVPLVIVHRGENGFGDATIVWEPDTLPDYPQLPDLVPDDVFQVSVDNVGVSGAARAFTYRVTLIDPEAEVVLATSTATATGVVATPTATSTGTVATPTASATATGTISTPTASATPTRGSTPTPSATATAPASDTPPRPTDTDTPEPPPPNEPVPVRCPNLRAPEAVIQAALDNPATVDGWGTLCNPNVPFDPINNRWRTSLSLENAGVPYNPLTNGLEYKCGCR